MSALVHLYFWKNDEVRVLHESASDRDYQGCYCVDARFDDARQRYGRWPKGDGDWEHIPRDAFPKEFFVHLLLLGVPA